MFIAHCMLLIACCSRLVTWSSLHGAHYMVLIVWCLLCVAPYLCMLLWSLCSLFGAHYMAFSFMSFCRALFLYLDSHVYWCLLHSGIDMWNQCIMFVEKKCSGVGSLRLYVSCVTFLLNCVCMCVDILLTDVCDLLSLWQKITAIMV